MDLVMFSETFAAVGMVSITGRGLVQCGLQVTGQCFFIHPKLPFRSSQELESDTVLIGPGCVALTRPRVCNDLKGNPYLTQSISQPPAWGLRTMAS